MVCRPVHVSGCIQRRATAPKKTPPIIPAAGAAYPAAAPFPDALVAAADALLETDEVRLPTALVAELIKELPAAVALLTRLFSREEALAKTLLMRLDRLLWADGAAVAASDRRLEATDSASDWIEAASDVKRDTTESAPEGTLLAMDEASEAADVTNDPPTEVASEAMDPASDVASPATEVAPEAMDPATDVMSPAMEVAPEMTELTTEPTSWAETLTAKARSRVLERCIVRCKCVSKKRSGSSWLVRGSRYGCLLLFALAMYGKRESC